MVYETVTDIDQLLDRVQELSAGCRSQSGAQGL